MGLRKTILKFNPLNAFRMKKCKSNLKQNVTILASNCLGGLLYHDYGQKFLSPTVNTRFDTPDFVKFVCNIEKYLNENLRFIDSSEPFPVAMLDDVKINFVHYHTNEEAERKWNERKNRIDWNHVFVIANDNDNVTVEQLRMLDNCRFKNICVFTSKPMSDVHCAFPLKRFLGCKEVGNTMLRSLVSGCMPVQEEFDFTAWFNQDKGCDIKVYRK